MGAGILAEKLLSSSEGLLSGEVIALPAIHAEKEVFFAQTNRLLLLQKRNGSEVQPCWLPRALRLYWGTNTDSFGVNVSQIKCALTPFLGSVCSGSRLKLHGEQRLSLLEGELMDRITR